MSVYKVIWVDNNWLILWLCHRSKQIDEYHIYLIYRNVYTGSRLHTRRCRRSCCCRWWRGAKSCWLRAWSRRSCCCRWWRRAKSCCESHANINSPMIEIVRRKVCTQRKSLIFETGWNASFFSVCINTLGTTSNIVRLGRGYKKHEEKVSTDTSCTRAVNESDIDTVGTRNFQLLINPRGTRNFLHIWTYTTTHYHTQWHSYLITLDTYFTHVCDLLHVIPYA